MGIKELGPLLKSIKFKGNKFSKIDKQFSKGEKDIPILNPISSDLDVLRRSIFSNLAIYLKKNQE